MSSRANSRPESFDLAIVALSARALARSARRAGLNALAFDLFADSDTREHASRAVRVAGRGRGFSRRSLLGALREHAPEGLPVVLGAGFEHDPSLIAAIDVRNPVRGAAAATVAQLKDPKAFAALAAAIGALHPELGDKVTVQEGEWLSKRVGGSGGAHIRSEIRVGDRGRYLQRRVSGEPLSALFLADGAQALIVGFSRQWADPARDAAFRYGGAVGPVEVAPKFRQAVADILKAIVARVGLRGLASADLLTSADGGFVLLEINPRSGATLDVFDHAPAPPLLSLHLDACDGVLPDRVDLPAIAHAAAVVYAERPVAPGLLQRPVWTADWPACEEVIPSGAPVCTILAAGADPLGARALLDERRASLLEQLRAAAVRPSQTTMVHA